MQFPNPVVTELTAPNNVPLAPGNNVTGFGSQLPPELAAAGFTNAIVFYSTDWNPTNTTPTAKFKFIGTNGGSLIIGFGYCQNPSVSQTATIVSMKTVGLLDQGAGNLIPTTDLEVRNINNNTIFQFTQDGNGNKQPVFAMRTDAGLFPCQIDYAFSNAAATTLELGVNAAPWELIAPDSLANSVLASGPILKDSAWQPFTLFNGWTGAAGVDAPLYRMMPDGTCMMTGLLTKASAPVNGEQWGSVAAGYLPKSRQYFHACSDIASDGNQKIRINADGTCVIFDSPTGNGSICLSGVRYAVVNALP